MRVAAISRFRTEKNHGLVEEQRLRLQQSILVEGLLGRGLAQAREGVGGVLQTILFADAFELEVGYY